VEVDRGDREHLIAVDELTEFVDGDDPIGVAVEREADPRSRGQDRCLQLLGVRRPASVVDVRAVGRGVEHVDLGTQRAQGRGSGPECGTVAAIDHDVHPVELPPNE
jgi:hypothetical protein